MYIILFSILFLIIFLVLNKKKQFFNSKINKTLGTLYKKKVKILFFNDCGPIGHSGSKAVTELIENYLYKTYNVSILKKVTRYTHKNITDFDYDFIIVNGEGAFHDNQSDFRSLLKHIYKVKIPKYLINTCFYNDDIDKKYLSQFDLIYTREIISHQQLLQKHNINSILMLDLTFYYFHFNEKKEIIKNEFHNKILLTNFNEFRIKHNKIYDLLKRKNINFIKYNKFKELSWEKNINNFSNSKLVITDMQHVMINCIISHSKFVCFTSNIPKNEGILKTLNCNIPILQNAQHFESEIQHFLDGKYDEEYKQLFDKVEKLKFNMILKIFDNPNYNKIKKDSILLIGNSNEKSNINLDNFNDIVRFNNVDHKNYFTIHIINSIDKLYTYLSNFKKIKNLKVIIGDQKNILDNNSKLIYKYIPSFFLNKMRLKYNHKKNFSIELCSILFLLFFENYNKIHISNFNLNMKNNKNKIFNSNLSSKHDWKNEKIIIKKLIKDGRIVNI